MAILSSNICFHRKVDDSDTILMGSLILNICYQVDIQPLVVGNRDQIKSTGYLQPANQIENALV